KLSSVGQEFGAVAFDCFGERIDTRIVCASGENLAAGNRCDIYIIATDAAGNEKRSEIIRDIKIYGVPTIVPNNQLSINEGESLDFLFSAFDSFGNEVVCDVTTQDEIVSGNVISVTVRAADICGNEIIADFEITVL
ncbi:MAG: hypothetical protein K2N84_01600, partial [Clostridia bacterium]|nr:hypothetical protein [Clostridia bacterium]